MTNLISNQNGREMMEYAALAEFRYQIRRFLRFSELAAREAGLEPQHHQLLLAVSAMPPGKLACIGDIAERLQIRHHSAVELVGRTEAKGLVRRVRGRDDRREVLVQPTPKGEQILQALTVAHHQELERAAPVLVAVLNKLSRSARSRTVPLQRSSTSRRKRPRAAAKAAVGRKAR
jgi:DNA-binding MarR family transcriptional regulator